MENSPLADMNSRGRMGMLVPSSTKEPNAVFQFSNQPSTSILGSWPRTEPNQTRVTFCSSKEIGRSLEIPGETLQVPLALPSKGECRPGENLDRESESTDEEHSELCFGFFHAEKEPMIGFGLSEEKGRALEIPDESLRVPLALLSKRECRPGENLDRESEIKDEEDSEYETAEEGENEEIVSSLETLDGTLLLLDDSENNGKLNEPADAIKPREPVDLFSAEKVEVFGMGHDSDPIEPNAHDHIVMEDVTCSDIVGYSTSSSSGPGIEQPSRVPSLDEGMKSSLISKVGSLFMVLGRRAEGSSTQQPITENQLKRSCIDLPVPKNLRKYRWMKKSDRRFELGSSGYMYEGEITGQKMHGYGRLTLGNRDFIEGHWEGNRLMVLNSCRLQYRSSTFNMVKTSYCYLLFIYEQQFVATVALESLDRIDFKKSTGEVKEALFGKLTILEVLRDELRVKRQEILDRFTSTLKEMTDEHADPITRANTFILLSRGGSSDIRLDRFMHNSNVPEALKSLATALNTSDEEYRNLHTFLKKEFVPLDLSNVAAEIYKGGIEKHRKMLIEACPDALPSLVTELRRIDDSKLIYVSKADINVFEQLTIQPFFEPYKDCVQILVRRFGQALDKIRTDSSPDKIMPIISPVFEYLVRRFWEIISEIIETADDYNHEKMLKSESGDWEIEGKIKWLNEQSCNAQEQKVATLSEKKSFYRRSLEVQYNFVFRILKFMFPDNYIREKRFPYVFRVLEGLPGRFQCLSQGRLVWLYIMDHTIHEVFKDYPKILERYLPFVQRSIQFMQNSPLENYESFRALTHNALNFVTSASPYVEEPSRDVEELSKKVDAASQASLQNPSTCSDFKDLMTEVNRYLNLRHHIEIEAAPGHFSALLTHMNQRLMHIVENSLKKPVPTSALVWFFRPLNDFLDDFRSIDFLGMWYIKRVAGYDNLKVVEKVDNKLSAGKHSSFRVIDIETFVADHQLLGIPPPDHYIIEIVTALLGCVEECLEKEWQTDEEQPLAQLKTAGVLLEAIRRSFMYLKEQPDYVDFLAFKKESVEPFVQLAEDCSTLDDLKTRAVIVKESFWYLRKMDEIGIDQAMVLMREANTHSISGDLLTCYNLYLSTYNKYIEEYTAALSYGKSHGEGLDAVKKMLKPAQSLHYSKWNEQFKAEEIPVFLAGLSAVWSILISKDLSGTGKFLKPHCIQILCILRLLSIYRPKGVENHLAQVLTGQGKSVILGLLSSILALTGHEVRVMCYSEYLSSRDQNDFSEFFDTFHITHLIKYDTFGGMAEEILTPMCDGKLTGLRQMVEDRVLHHKNWSKMSATEKSENAVLLIDEVDVFFHEDFYGNAYYPVSCVGLRGLDTVQENIWSLAMNLKRLPCNEPVQEIVDRTKQFIKQKVAAGNNDLSHLNDFMIKPGFYPLLIGENNNFVRKDYTNQALFNEHLREMSKVAWLVANTESKNFKINSDGMICQRSNKMLDVEWQPNLFCGYYNTFYYFKLKGSNYDHNHYGNYGYLLVETGAVSYARLPSQFQLILGVSGTLENLNQYEKSGIKSYNIHSYTILPSFFGDSNLLFDEEADFHCYAVEADWLKDIYNQATRMVQASRAVLVFFESDSKMNLFMREYKTKFDRLNEITTNTDPKLRDTYIEEVGLQGAVTLATRGMGRGVDYKSSLSVEKHGGVHVIQTFYSKDIKEEIQIKGRTARVDNKGSYEIIICRTHLIEKQIVQNGDLTAYNYASLAKIRQALSEEGGRTVTEKINQS